MTYIPEKQALLIESKPFFKETFSYRRGKFNNLLIATDSKKLTNTLNAYKPEILLLNPLLNQDDTTQLSKNIAFFIIPITLICPKNNPKIYKAVMEICPIAYLSNSITPEILKLLTLIGQQKIINLSTSTSLFNNNVFVPKIEGEIFIKIGNTLKKICLNDIDWFGVNGKYAYVKTANKELLLNLSLKDLEKKLDKNNFARIHQSYLINIRKIDTINIIKNTVNMKNVELPIGRSFKKDFLSRIQCF